MHQLRLTNSYTSLAQEFYQLAHAEPCPTPEIVIYNNNLAKKIGFPTPSHNTEYLVQWLTGQNLPHECTPIAQAYAGHQFGNLALLGDGRALLLGELTTPKEELIDIQLKGSGRTPYSRSGDGRATVAAMLREYLMSEAMHALNIPTTRSLAVVTTGNTVYRHESQQGAILTRTAASHIRIGTFVYASIISRQQQCTAPLKELLDYSCSRHYPELNAITDITQKAVAFIAAVGKRQIALINHWLRVGFIHGVMNTDNVCISGETIDYGPCSFMNAYHDSAVFSSIDHQGRYAYGNQSPVILWNITRLAESLLPLISDTSEHAIALASNTIEELALQQHIDWTNMMSHKLGLTMHVSDSPIANCDLIERLLTIMQKNTMDFTNTFVSLTQFIQKSIQEASKTHVTASDMLSWFTSTDYQHAEYTVTDGHNPDFNVWSGEWITSLNAMNTTHQDWYNTYTTMQYNNPVVIPRNKTVEEALTSATSGDMELFQNVLAVTSKPYAMPQLSGYQKAPSTKYDATYQTFCGT